MNQDETQRPQGEEITADNATPPELSPGVLTDGERAFNAGWNCGEELAKVPEAFRGNLFRAYNALLEEYLRKGQDTGFNFKPVGFEECAANLARLFNRIQENPERLSMPHWFDFKRDCGTVFCLGGWTQVVFYVEDETAVIDESHIKELRKLTGGTSDPLPDINDVLGGNYTLARMVDGRVPHIPPVVTSVNIKAWLINDMLFDDATPEDVLSELEDRLNICGYHVATYDDGRKYAVKL